jgi:hypothetical protein
MAQMELRLLWEMLFLLLAVEVVEVGQVILMV